MLTEEITDPDSVTPADLERTYLSDVAVAIDLVGVDTVVDETNLSRKTAEALVEGKAPDLTLSDAAAVLGMQEDSPDAETILLEVRDDLLMAMSIAVVDVDTLAFELDSDRTPRAIQQQIEGRAPMSLAEYAEIRHWLARRRH